MLSVNSNFPEMPFPKNESNTLVEACPSLYNNLTGFESSYFIVELLNASTYNVSTVVGISRVSIVVNSQNAPTPTKDIPSVIVTCFKEEGTYVAFAAYPPAPKMYPNHVISLFSYDAPINGRVTFSSLLQSANAPSPITRSCLFSSGTVNSVILRPLNA